MPSAPGRPGIPSLPDEEHQYLTPHLQARARQVTQQRPMTTMVAKEEISDFQLPVDSEWMPTPLPIQDAPHSHSNSGLQTRKHQEKHKGKATSPGLNNINRSRDPPAPLESVPIREGPNFDTARVPLSMAGRYKNGDSSTRPTQATTPTRPRRGDSSNAKTTDRSDKGKGKQVATSFPPAQSPLLAQQSTAAHPQHGRSQCSDESAVTRAWSGSDRSGETLVDPNGEEPVPPPEVPRPQLAQSQVHRQPMSYGTVYGNLLGPVPSPVPSPIQSPELAPVSPMRGTFSDDGDEVDLYLTPDIVIGGRQPETSSSGASEAGVDQDSFKDYVSLGDLSGSTLQSFDSMPSNFRQKINQSDKFQDRTREYLQDMGKYNPTHWLATAEVDFGLAPTRRPRQTRQDARLAQSLSSSYLDLPRGHVLREPLQAMPLEPTSPAYFLRMKILSSFVARCAAAKHPVPLHPNPKVAQFQNGTTAPCPLCAKAGGFLMLHGHNTHFLDKIMQPMSELITYAEMTTLLNAKILQRAFDEVELDTRTPQDAPYPWECVRSKPTIEEFEAVLYEAQMQFMVFDTGKIIVDENGMVAAAPGGLRK